MKEETPSDPNVLKITFDPSIGAAAALRMVARTIDGGRVSKGRNGRQYCWGTIFGGEAGEEACVWANRAPTMDTFRVELKRPSGPAEIGRGVDGVAYVALVDGENEVAP